MIVPLGLRSYTQLIPPNAEHEFGIMNIIFGFVVNVNEWLDLPQHFLHYGLILCASAPDFFEKSNAVKFPAYSCLML